MGDVVEELAQRSMPRLCAYGYALTGSASASAELVQAAVASVMSRSHRPSGRDAERTVLAQMRRLHLGGQRRVARWVGRDIAVGKGSAGEGDPFAPESADARERPGDSPTASPTSGAWVALPPRVRTALALRIIEGLPDDVIARQLRLPEQAVHTLLGQACTELEQSLGVPHDESVAVLMKGARR